MNSYIDRKGRTLFVHDGISGGRWWCTYYRRHGSLKRLVSPSLPIHPSREQAEADLEAYARRRRLPRGNV